MILSHVFLKIKQNITMRDYLSEFLPQFCFALQFSSSYPHLACVNSLDIMIEVKLNIMKIFVNDSNSMVPLSYNFFLFFNKLHFSSQCFLLSGSSY